MDIKYSIISKNKIVHMITLALLYILPRKIKKIIIYQKK